MRFEAMQDRISAILDSRWAASQRTPLFLDRRGTHGSAVNSRGFTNSSNSMTTRVMKESAGIRIEWTAAVRFDKTNTFLRGHADDVLLAHGLRRFVTARRANAQHMISRGCPLTVHSPSGSRLTT